MLSNDEKNVIETIRLMYSLREACKKLHEYMKNYLVATCHKPSKVKSLWLAFAQTFYEWERELFGDAIADAGSQNFIEAAAICKRLSKAKCEANTEAQLGIAEYLGITLEARTFGLSFRHNRKAITADDLKGLIRAIDLVMPDVLMYVRPDCLNSAIVMLDTKKVVENMLDYELYSKVIDVKEALLSYRQAMNGYRIARMDYLGEEYPPLGMPDEPTTDKAEQCYASLLNGFRVDDDEIETEVGNPKVSPMLEATDAYLRPAMRDIGIGSMPIPVTDDVEVIDETVSAIERAFYETLIRKGTHALFINALVDLTKKDL
jgi:hypothetical protein